MKLLPPCFSFLAACLTCATAIKVVWFSFMASNAVRFIMQRVASLLRTVQYILAVASRPKVIGVNTGWHIARMTDVEAIRYRPDECLVTESMGEPHFATKCDLTVPGVIDRRSPKPATRLNYFAFFFKSFDWVCAIALLQKRTQLFASRFLLAMGRAITIIAKCFTGAFRERAWHGVNYA